MEGLTYQNREAILRQKDKAIFLAKVERVHASQREEKKLKDKVVGIGLMALGFASYAFIFRPPVARYF
jgi:hypothetical protein